MRKLKLLLLTTAIISASEREIEVRGEVYSLRLNPVSCAAGKKVECGTPMMPRRYRGEVVKDGRVVGRFDKPCAEVCTDLEKTVERAVRR